MRNKTSTDVSITDIYNSRTPFNDSEKTIGSQKRILIVGANSYIGTSFQQYLNSNEYQIAVLDAVNLIPNSTMFERYDIVFCVVGIVHKTETCQNQLLYYKVNRDLVIDIARAAKEGGISQFILLSSMAVYGKIEGHITQNTKAEPQTHYGRSKLQADEIILSMRGSGFSVAVLRPPIVYGKGCKGNYQLLRNFALKSPIVPYIQNERSMIYIGNLCEFVKTVIDKQRDGIFLVQNEEYVCTSDMIQKIAGLNNKHLLKIKICNLFLHIFPSKTIKKAFGSLTYEKSEIVKKYSFNDSIRLTELDNEE